MLNGKVGLMPPLGGLAHDEVRMARLRRRCDGARSPVQQDRLPGGSRGGACVRRDRGRHEAPAPGEQKHDGAGFRGVHPAGLLHRGLLAHGPTGIHPVASAPRHGAVLVGLREETDQICLY